MLKERCSSSAYSEALAGDHQTHILPVFLQTCGIQTALHKPEKRRASDQHTS